MKKAFITGVTGQDGSYLADLLLDKGYEVHGMIRRNSAPNPERIESALKRGLKTHYGDLADGSNIFRTLEKIAPDEIYNLGAMSHVQVSFMVPEYTADVDALGTIRLLEAVQMLRDRGIYPRYYQASSSEMFGKVQEIPQKETTPFYPRSPYGCAKVYSYWATVNYREAYGMFASNGILFNHESPRRGEFFVTRKITKAVARIMRGSTEKLALGNLDAKRDWGYAKEFVEAMWLMLQHEQADDFVIATGETHTVREFVQEAFSIAGLDWEKHVVIDPALFRPTEVDLLIGDASKAKWKLGWEPKTKFKELVRLMLEEDYRRIAVTL